MKKESFVKRHPHFIRLPKDSLSPTGSIYGMYDIVKGSKALWRDSNWSYTLRSSEPFSVKILTKGKEKILNSRVK